MAGLHHTADEASSAKREKAARAKRVRRSLEDIGTTAKSLPGVDNPEWTADLEYVWRVRTAAEVQRLDRRAKRQRRVALDRGRRADVAWEMGDVDTWRDMVGERVAASRSARWADQRARAMALPRAEVIAACGARTRVVRCGCSTIETRVGCDQTTLCAQCRRRHWQRWRRRITRSMDAHLRAARGEWARAGRRGMLPGIYLVTLTTEHSGSIADDRAALAKGWRALSKVANARRWWGAYALTYEVTPGRDGRGHVHIHLAAISSWIPYEDLHAAWRAACPGSLILDVSAPRSSRRANVADYLAKYVTKGVEPAVFTGQKAGELLVAFRGKRKVTTSAGFWRPLQSRSRNCRSCGRPHVLVQSPGALQTVAPGAVLQAMAERIGWWVPRGAHQTEMGGVLVSPDG